jgi:ABC-type transport system involved in cytochrome c biogenesis permease component
MNGLSTILKRELRAYFATPVAYVFIVIFLVLAGVATFYMGGFYERGQADLEPFFQFHPWLYMFLIPAISMRLWSEERKAGTLELLLTLPVPLGAAVVGKFLAAWIFTAVALAGTLPLWLTVNYLGDPDNTVILAGYLGSLLMAGGFLAIGACLSALTKQPGHRLRRDRRRSASPSCSQRLSPGPRRLQRVGAAGHRRRDQLLQLPDPFQFHRQRRDRRARRGVLRHADRVLAVCQRARHRNQQEQLTPAMSNDTRQRTSRMHRYTLVTGTAHRIRRAGSRLPRRSTILPSRASRCGECVST